MCRSIKEIRLSPNSLSRLSQPAFVALLAFALAAQSAVAHKLAATTTEMVWLPDSGHLQVTHTIHLDDAISLLATLGDVDATMEFETQARVLLYILARYTVSIADEPLPLEPIGAQLEGDYLWVYFESDPISYPERLQVSTTLMQEFSASTQNLIQFRVADVVRSVTLDASRTDAEF